MEERRVFITQLARLQGVVLSPVECVLMDGTRQATADRCRQGQRGGGGGRRLRGNDVASRGGAQ
jgi:hypothetical protein